MFAARAELAQVARQEADRLERGIGLSEAGKKTIVLNCDSAAARGPEGHTLDVRKDGVTITSASPAGVFYGVCTLLQLLDADSTRVPCVSIVDWPDFRARDLILAVADFARRERRFGGVLEGGARPADEEG